MTTFTHCAICDHPLTVRGDGSTVHAAPSALRLAAMVAAAIDRHALPSGRLELHLSAAVFDSAGAPDVVAGIPVVIEARLSGGWLLVEVGLS